MIAARVRDFFVTVLSLSLSPATMVRPSVVAGVSLPCDAPRSDESIDPMRIVRRLAKLCEMNPSLNVHISLNCYTGVLNSSRVAQAASKLQRCRFTSEISSIKGQKPLFWRSVLAPQNLPPAVQFVWLVDADMAVDQFALQQAVGELVASNASVAQPRIAPFRHARGRTTDWPLLRMNSRRAPWPEGCQAASINYLEVQSPIFRREAWSIVHRKLLLPAKSSMLANTDCGISEVWCGLLANISARPACALLRSSIVHRDEHLIERAARLANATWIHRKWRQLRGLKFDVRRAKGCEPFTRGFKPFLINTTSEWHRKEPFQCLSMAERGSPVHDGPTWHERNFIRA